MNEKAVVKPTVVDVDELLPPLPPRPSTAEHAASVLRGQIAQGRLPGTRLREEHVVESFAISRNTVREAFRLLAHEGLVDHVAYRGVHVRRMGADDVLALYRTRRLVEPLGLRGDRRWRGPGCDAGSGRQRHRCRRADRLARRRHGGHRVRPGDLRRLPQCAHFGDVGDVPRRTAAGLPAVARPRATPPAVPGQKSRSPSLDRSSRRGCSLRPSWTTT